MEDHLFGISLNRLDQFKFEHIKDYNSKKERQNDITALDTVFDKVMFQSLRRRKLVSNFHSASLYRVCSYPFYLLELVCYEEINDVMLKAENEKHKKVMYILLDKCFSSISYEFQELKLPFIMFAEIDEDNQILISYSEGYIFDFNTAWGMFNDFEFVGEKEPELKSSLIGYNFCAIRKGELITTSPMFLIEHKYNSLINIDHFHGEYTILLDSIKLKIPNNLLELKCDEKMRISNDFEMLIRMKFNDYISNSRKR